VVLDRGGVVVDNRGCVFMTDRRRVLMIDRGGGVNPRMARG